MWKDRDRPAGGLTHPGNQADQDLEMELVDLATQPAGVRDQAARLLHQRFNHSNGWPSLGSAREEIARILRAGFARALLEDRTLLGWVGGLPEYGGRVWELHPLVVREASERRGVGRALVAAFEAEAASRGAFTVTLGTDDDAGITSLADTDLYDDIPRHLAELRDLGRHHPFLFYRKLGFVVTGVMPDANGPGRPDIYMSKPVRRR
jgi:aminoglycoside 6'-N-acetyltransferase I